MRRLDHVILLAADLAAVLPVLAQLTVYVVRALDLVSECSSRRTQSVEIENFEQLEPLRTELSVHCKQPLHDRIHGFHLYLSPVPYDTVIQAAHARQGNLFWETKVRMRALHFVFVSSNSASISSGRRRRKPLHITRT